MCDERKKGTREVRVPFFSLRADESYRFFAAAFFFGAGAAFFAAFFFAAFFFAKCRPPLRWCALRANSQRTAPFGRAAIQENGAPRSGTPKSVRKNYRFFAAFFATFFFAAFAFLAIGSLSSGCCGSTSDGHQDCHNGWAEPSTLIPDVDYG